MDEKVIGILAAAVGVAPTEAAGLATTDEGIAQLQTKLTAKLAGIKDDADGRALKLVTQAFKASGVDAVVFEKGREFKENLAAAVSALESKAAEKAGDGLTPEQALAHPAVKQKLNEAATATASKVKEAEDRLRGELETERAAITRDRTVAKVSEQANAIIAQLNPVFSADPTRAAHQRAKLLAEITAGNFVEVSGRLYPADKDGEVLQVLGNPVDLDAYVRQQTTSLYDLPTSTDRSSPGIKPGETASGAYAGPKTQEEVDAKTLELQRATPAERAKVQTDFDAWQATQSKP